MSVAQLNLILDDSVELIKLSRSGISFSLFQKVMDSTFYTVKQWSDFLHLTERTIQRYKKDKKKFDSIYAEKIIEIAKLNKKGEEVFGSLDNFGVWMNSKIIALGGVKPVELLDNSFGIDLVYDQLGRIEHGILS